MECPSCLPSVGGYASNTPFIMIIPGNFPTIPGYSENLPDYSRIFPDSFNHLLCSKLCRHNRRMPSPTYVRPKALILAEAKKSPIKDVSNYLNDIQ